MQEPSRHLVLVHGFTGTSDSWHEVVSRLDGDFTISRVDLPGHGEAPASDLNFEETAHAIGRTGGPGTYIGYSMGGRLCLRLAFDRPDLVQRLVLIGASPGLASPAERAARREADERLAASIERDGTERFLRRWLSHPLFATLDPSPEELARREQNTPDGLARALRQLGPGVQEPLWNQLRELDLPVLLVAGELDSKYAAIARRMVASGLRGAELAVVPGTGHAVHLENPAACADLVRTFVQDRSS